jgi:hypothetical protein
MKKRPNWCGFNDNYALSNEIIEPILMEKIPSFAHVNDVKLWFEQYR